MLRHLGIRSATSQDDDGCDLLRHNRDGHTTAATGGSMSSEDDEFLADCQLSSDGARPFSTSREEQPLARSATASLESDRPDDGEIERMRRIEPALESIELALRNGGHASLRQAVDGIENRGMAMEMEDPLPLHEARNTRLRVGTSAGANASAGASTNASSDVGAGAGATAGATTPTSRHVVFILCCLQALLSVSEGQTVATSATHPSRCLTPTAHHHITPPITDHRPPVVRCPLAQALRAAFGLAQIQHRRGYQTQCDRVLAPHRRDFHGALPDLGIGRGPSGRLALLPQASTINGCLPCGFVGRAVRILHIVHRPRVLHLPPGSRDRPDSSIGLQHPHGHLPRGVRYLRADAPCRAAICGSDHPSYRP